MKSILAMSLGLSLAALAVQAADDKQPQAPKAPPASSPVPKGYEKYDTNGDGKLDEAERTAMREALRKQAEARRKEMLAKYDKNGDGKLDAEEIKAYREDLKKQASERTQPKQPAKPQEKKPEPQPAPEKK